VAATGRGRFGVAGRLALAVVVLAALILPGRLLAVEHRGDDELVRFAGGSRHGTAAPGQTWHVDTGVFSTDRDRIKVVEVRPRVSTDTAIADIAFELCTPLHPGDIDAATGPLSDSCRTVSGAEGGWTRLRPRRAHLVVSLTPHRAGVVKIDGFDVTYVDHGRRGTEYAGWRLRLHVP
jgi:hypothetical protein